MQRIVCSESGLEPQPESFQRPTDLQTRTAWNAPLGLSTGLFMYLLSMQIPRLVFIVLTNGRSSSCFYYVLNYQAWWV